MSHDTLAMVLWLMLGLSTALTIAGVAARASWVLFVAAFLSFVFGIFAIFSIGIFILALALVQLVIGIGIRRQTA
jgi:hypothetical protein